MAETRSFHLGDILSVTTGRLVSPRQINGIYDILNFMTGDNLYTHQLPRACDECQAPLLAQHPDLAAVQVPGDLTGGGWEKWLADQVAAYGEYRPVAPLADASHTRVDPVTELRMIRPDVQIITITVPGDSDA